MNPSVKRAFLISCSDHYDDRLHLIDHCLKMRGFNTTYITSDFDHNGKKVFKCSVDGCVQLHAKPYMKNLSLARIVSHRNFARDVFRYIEGLEEQPEIICVQLPPNFLGHYAAKYKKRHPQVKMVFDIFDMWPETFPGGRVKKLLAPIFRVWAYIRDHSLYAADFITCECEMFLELLNLDSEKSKVIYLCKEDYDSNNPTILQEDKIHLCYLGAINNIISIADICSLIKQVSAKKPVILHIIGKGEREQEFVESARAAGAEVVFYGAVYDENKKDEIISRCHFGLNIMKSSVCVGLTMKSLDYFRFGLPIISNIKGDTRRLVKEKHIGIELDDYSADKLVNITSDECFNMRERVKTLFKEQFEKSVVAEKYFGIIDRITKN